MNTYETLAIVEEQGRVLVAGVAFTPGTQIDVVISPIENSVTVGERAAGRAERLLAALDKSPQCGIDRRLQARRAL